ncbi:MAG: phosphomannomutase/phosphoglucomutase [Pseudomonadales bacterium]
MAKAKKADAANDIEIADAPNDSEKAAKAKPKHNNASSTPDQHWLPPAISFLSIAAIVGLVLIILIPQRQATDLQRHTELYASSQAVIVKQSIEQLQNRLEMMAAAPEVRKTVSDKSTDAMHQMSQRLSAAFPEASGAMVIPLDSKGITGLRKHGLKLRNNIESSMVNRAEDGDKTFPEAYKYQGETQFTLVAPILEADEMEVNGAILLRMSMAFLQSAIDSQVEDRGRTELIQIFSGNEQVLLSSSGTGDSNLAPQNKQIGESNWWLRFTPSKVVATELSIPLWSLLALLGIPALGVPIWHFLSLRKLGNHMQDDLDNVISYTQSLMSGNKRMPPVFPNSKLNQLANLIASFRTPAASDDVSRDTAAPGASTSAASAPKKAKVKTPAASSSTATKAAPAPKLAIPEHIFRAYDIRGEADKYLTDDVVKAIGRAIGSEALDRSQNEIVVACDGRLSSPRIKKALCEGLLASGQNIIDIGEQPTPLLYFATHHLETGAGVMITGSHNGAECNGLKLVLEGRPLAGEHIQNIRQRIDEGRYHEGQGSMQEANVADAYIETIAGDIAVAQTLKIVVDAANGIGGVIGPRVLEELGCEVIALHCEVDGNFPNHAPDPTIAKNLDDLAFMVKEHEADFGIAFDGDADRVCVVDSNGNAIAPDILLMLFAQDIVSRNPGADIIYDVKCTRHLSTVISSYGGRPIMWKSGHSCIKEKMLQTGALLGGEFTGHICFKERWFGFDDGIYSAARLIEIVSTSGLKLEELVEEYPASKSTPEIIVDTGEQQKFDIVEALTDNAQFGSGKITTLDGIRVDYPDGWGLIRPSNTVPAITLRFEADNDEALQRIQTVFREQIGLVNPNVASAF